MCNMRDIKRIFLVVLDSVGVGHLPDAQAYGDVGSNTLRSCWETGLLNLPTMHRLGLFQIDGIDYATAHNDPIGSFGRMAELSPGKDTTTGHWELSGIVSDKPLPTYPNGFPDEIIAQFEQKSGCKTLCNKPYSGTDVLLDFGQQHMSESKNVIVYTSADSVFQIAAHSDVLPINELYRICEIARSILVGNHGVGRVIARPFEGVYPVFSRTPLRKDFSLAPPRDTILNILSKSGLDTIGVGKINDIFSGSGITHSIPSKGNRAVMESLEELIKKDFTGLCFANLVDFDMLFGHRNNVHGYATALNEFDIWLGGVLPRLKSKDLLMITADHGCDPGFKGTDHTREYVPLLVYGAGVKPGENLGTRGSFADVGKTVSEMFGVEADIDGESFGCLI